MLALCLGVLVAPVARAQEEHLLTPLVPEPAQESKPKRTEKKTSAPKLKKRPVVSTLHLVHPEGASPRGDLFVDDQPMGTLLVDSLELSPGKHVVRIVSPGHADFVRKVSLRRGQDVQLEVKLEPVAALLTVTTNEPGALVLLDGRVLGPAPVRDYLMDAGAHQLRVEHEGFEPRKVELNAELGKTHTVHVDLTPIVPEVSALTPTDRPEQMALMPEALTAALTLPPKVVEHKASVTSPWYRRWYVWAAVGAVVVGGVTTVIIVRNHSAKASAPNPCSLNGVPRTCDGQVGTP